MLTTNSLHLIPMVIKDLTVKINNNKHFIYVVREVKTYSNDGEYCYAILENIVTKKIRFHYIMSSPDKRGTYIYICNYLKVVPNIPLLLEQPLNMNIES